MAKMSPRERRQARTRDEILDAALAIINEKGPEQLTLRALARRVDYSPAGLYEYFESKDDIIYAVCAEGDRRLLAEMRSVSLDLPADEYLVQLGLAYIRFARQNRDHFLLMFSHAPEGPKIPYEQLGLSETYRILLDAVQTAIQSGLFPVQAGFDQDEVAYPLWALVHGLATLQLTSLRIVDYDFAAADRAALEHFVRGLQT